MPIQPSRGIVTVNNQIIRFTSLHVEQNAFSAADSFEVVLPFFIRHSQSGDLILANGPDFQSILLTQDVVPVSIWVGYPPNPFNYQTSDLTQIMDGYMDTAHWQFDNTGTAVTLNGRNKTALFMDNKIYDKLPNLTSSRIAETLATSHGLATAVAPTTTLAGTYYNQNSAVLGTDISEWDLLLFLAQQENFIVRVKGNILYFGPYSLVTGFENQDPIPFTWGQNIEKLEFERSPHAARDIIVRVITYDRNGKNRIVETAKSTTQYAQRIKNQTGQREAYTETYIIPGLTREQAQKKAVAINSELSRAALIGQITVAGNTDMAIDRKIAIQGVGQGLSGTFYLNKVTHDYDLDSGYDVSASFSNQFLADDSVQGVA
jgi:hypothetical protein